MNTYKKTTPNIWSGRTSKSQLYFHEKIRCIDLTTEAIPKHHTTSFAIIGYACDEGVRRNQGRVGAAHAPDSIRKMMAPLANHFEDHIPIYDVGDIVCKKNNLEKTHTFTSEKIAQILQQQHFCIAIGGGHDLAYAHYNGIKQQCTTNTIGIINLDAHFDLRPVLTTANSGTPFYQIAQENDHFHYLCLGIQQASNHKELYAIAHQLGVQYIENTSFRIDQLTHIHQILADFIASVDYIYLTIDMDGFSSIYAPGVSAPSPFGFSIDIVMKVLQQLCNSNKLISTDIVELNPTYDIDHCTARLAARIIHMIITLVSNQTIENTTE